MTYQNFISRVRQEVNVFELLPEIATDDDLVAEMLFRAYAAILVVAGDVPIARLPHNQTSLSPTASGGIKQAPLPEDLFAQRADFGIAGLLLDGRSYDIPASYSFTGLRAAAGNVFQKKVAHASLRIPERKVYFVNADTVSLVYCPRPAAPTVEDFQDKPVPLSGNDIETAVQLHAAHVTGNRGGDPQLSAMHQQFSQLYLTRS